MNNSLLDRGLRRVAFIDDEPDDSLSEMLDFKAAGFEPFMVPGPFDNVEDLVQKVQSEADFVVCDNALQPYNYANFFGAEAVARWYESNFPAVLVTQYHADLDSSIRLRRRQVPAALDKNSSNIEIITRGIIVCLEEFSGNFSPEREPVRTMLSIVRVDRDRSGLYAHVLSWDAEKPVFFPDALLKPELRGTLGVGDLLTGMVNTGAHNADDLFFYDLRPAPEPLSEDLLGKP